MVAVPTGGEATKDEESHARDKIKVVGIVGWLFSETYFSLDLFVIYL